MGYLGRDAEVITVGNGQQCMRLNIATSTRFKRKDTNEYEERTTWHRVVVWGDRLIAATAPYARKGAMVFVEGVPEIRKYRDREDIERESHEVVVSQVGVLRIPPPPRGGYAGNGSAAEEQDRPTTQRTPPQRSAPARATPTRPTARKGSLASEVDSGIDGFDDDIPF